MQSEMLSKTIQWPQWLKHLSKLYFIFAGVCALAGTYVFKIYIADDAYISYRFSKFIAAGFGHVWNAGEKPLYGSTSIFHTVLDSIAISAGFDPIHFNKLMGFLFLVLTVVCIYQVIRDLTSTWQARFGAGLFLLQPSLLFQFQHGLETGFWIFFHSFCLWAFVRKKEGLLAAGLLLLSSVRPEGLMFSGVYLVIYSLFVRRSRFLISAYLAGMLIYFGSLYAYFGAIVPSAAGSKWLGALSLIKKLLNPADYGNQYIKNYVSRFALLLAGGVALSCIFCSGKTRVQSMLSVFRLSKDARTVFFLASLNCVIFTWVYFLFSSAMDIEYRFRVPGLVYFVVWSSLIAFEIAKSVRISNFGYLRSSAFLALLVVFYLPSKQCWVDSVSYSTRMGYALRNGHLRIANLLKTDEQLKESTIYSTSAGVINYMFPGKAIHTFPASQYPSNDPSIDDFSKIDIIALNVVQSMENAPLSDPRNGVYASLIAHHTPVDEFEYISNFRYGHDQLSAFNPHLGTTVQIFAKKSFISRHQDLIRQLKAEPRFIRYEDSLLQKYYDRYFPGSSTTSVVGAK
jgi:hypothetical protein